MDKEKLKQMNYRELVQQYKLQKDDKLNNWTNKGIDERYRKEVEKETYAKERRAYVFCYIYWK